MSLPFHTIWFGGAIPLHHLENLCNILASFEQELPNWPNLEFTDRSYMPLLWLDRRFDFLP
jgi:hypothetical protein